MSIGPSVADILAERVTLEVECIDRMHLNVYVPSLQYEGGVVGFFRKHRGRTFASSVLMDPTTKAFVADVHDFVQREDVPPVAFRKEERKDDIAQRHLAGFDREEGVVFVAERRRRRRVHTPPQPRDRQDLRVDRA